MPKKKINNEFSFPFVIETFRNPVPSIQNDFRYHPEPSSFNGVVNVRKYKITVELINEPIELIHERLEKLWLECDNWHNWQPLENQAKLYNYTFKGERGSKKQTKIYNV